MTNRYADRCADKKSISWVLLLGCIAAVFQTQWSLATEPQMQAHYVRLEGMGGANTRERQTMLEYQASCLEFRRSQGKPVPFAIGHGVPDVITPVTVEIYYVANRTLEIIEGKHHSLDPIECHVKQTRNRTMVYLSAVGECRVDALKRTARGVCDLSLHERAPLRSAGLMSRPSDAGIDWSRIPVAQRERLQAQLKRFSSPGPAEQGNVLSTGEKHTVAGETCSVYRTLLEPVSEYCLAQPVADRQGRVAAPHPFPGSALSAQLPGMLLESRNHIMPLTAQEVRWGIAVDASLFRLPPGVQVIMNVPPKQQP